jgi:protein-tyrosine phosphatase
MSMWFLTYGFAEVGDELLVGAYPLDAADAERLRSAGVERVLNLCEDAEYRDGDRAALVRAYEAIGIEEERVPFTDFDELPEDGIDDALAVIDRWRGEGHRVYLHCRAGMQRSTIVAAADIARREGLDADTAVARVRERKPTADPLPHQLRSLRRWLARAKPAAPPPPDGGES